MKIIRTSDPFKALRANNQFLQEGPGIVIYHNTQGPTVLTGAFNTLDNDLCAFLQIPILKAPYLAGTIVSFLGDWEVSYISWGYSEFAPQLVRQLFEQLIIKQLPASLDNNDLLLAGRKVASWARVGLSSGYFQNVVHFSVTSDVDLISQICTKPMIKIPGALSDFNITDSDLESLINEAIRKEENICAK